MSKRVKSYDKTPYKYSELYQRWFAASKQGSSGYNPSTANLLAIQHSKVWLGVSYAGM